MRKVSPTVIRHNSGLTSSEKIPSAKIRNAFADCYFLNLTSATRKVLAFANIEFYEIFKSKSEGLLEDIELMYIDLPEEYAEIARRVTAQASKEMTK